MPNKQSQTSTEPRLGIFWLLRGKLLYDVSPLPEGEPYGDHLTHPRSHIEVWSAFQHKGIAPTEFEYEALPRGRVVFHRPSGNFTILADACILRHNSLIREIKKHLSLPHSTTTDRDRHYQCIQCLYRCK